MPLIKKIERYEAALQKIAQYNHPDGCDSNELAIEALGDRFVDERLPVALEEFWGQFERDTREAFKELSREALRPYYEGYEALIRAFGWRMWYEGLSVPQMYVHRIKKQETTGVNLLSLFNKK